MLYRLMINCQAERTENLSDIEILNKEITIRENTILVTGKHIPPNFSENNFTTKRWIIISWLSNKYEKCGRFQLAFI